MSIPAPGSRGPRRELTMSEAEVADRIERARETLRQQTELVEKAAAVRDDLARQCVALHDAGLSMSQIGTALDIDDQRVNRLIKRGRQLA